MADYSFLGGSRRKFWIYSSLLFLAGVILGMLFGVFGVRYFFFRFPPPPAEMAKRNAQRIQNDFGLDEATRATIEKENLEFFGAVHDAIRRTRVTIDGKLREHVAKIADALPNDELRRRWLQEYPRYFPKGPPPPHDAPPVVPPQGGSPHRG